MKKLLLLLAFIFVGMSAQSQEISTDQWTLVTKRTADWCPFCGTWGWEFKNNVLEDIQDKEVVFWMAHHSGNLETPTAQAILDNFGGGGQPRFFLNNDDMGVVSGNISSKRTEFQQVIDGINSFEAFGGVGSSATFDGEKISNIAKAKFFVGSKNSNYWLASYLVDDELIASQASQGSNAVHENILLHSLNGDNYFGENIVTGPVVAEEEFTVTGELDFSGQSDIPDYTDGYSIVTVLWTLNTNSGIYTPYNLNRQSISPLSSTADILSNIDVSAFHLGSGQVNINIESTEVIKNASVTLLDINGRTVATTASTDLNVGENQLILSTQELQLGTYIINVRSPKGSKSIKISVRP